MLTIRITGTALVAVALIAACGDPNVPTDVISTPTPQFDFTNNPDVGPRIVRYGSGFGWIIIDPRSGLFSLQATDMGLCIVPPAFLTANVQDIINNPDDPDASKVEELLLGRDLYILVYEDFEGWIASGATCAGLDARRLAQGTGNVTYTDSDVFIFNREHHDHDVFGATAQGRLELLAGGTASYAGVEKCGWDGVDDASFRCVDHITLTP